MQAPFREVPVLLGRVSPAPQVPAGGDESQGRAVQRIDGREPLGDGEQIHGVAQRLVGISQVHQRVAVIGRLLQASLEQPRAHRKGVGADRALARFDQHLRREATIRWINGIESGVGFCQATALIVQIRETGNDVGPFRIALEIRAIGLDDGVENWSRRAAVGRNRRGYARQRGAAIRHRFGARRRVSGKGLLIRGRQSGAARPARCR